MRIWITAPFDDDGIKEVETLSNPTDNFIEYIDGPNHIRCWWAYKEGQTWHRSREAAVDAAQAFRRDRINKAFAEATRLSALPPIAA